MVQTSRIRLPLQKTRIRSLGREDPLEKEMATHSSILAQRIPWAEEPGGLQSMGSQRVRHAWTHTVLLPTHYYCQPPNHSGQIRTSHHLHNRLTLSALCGQSRALQAGSLRTVPRSLRFLLFMFCRRPSTKQAWGWVPALVCHPPAEWPGTNHPHALNPGVLISTTGLIVCDSGLNSGSPLKRYVHILTSNTY